MPLNNFGMVTDSLYRSAQPNSFIDLKSLGFEYIIKLNSSNEFDLAVEQLEASPIEVVEIPLSSFIPTVQSVKLALTQLRNGKKTLVHCSHGRDRTGLFIGAYRLLTDKWAYERMEAERRLYGAKFILDFVDRGIVNCLKEIAKGL